jgi:hypothetical protein
VAEQVGTQRPERLDRYPSEGIGGRVDDRAGELAQLVAAATDAALGHNASEAAKILAAAEREAPERARQGQHGGTDGGVVGS